MPKLSDLALALPDSFVEDRTAELCARIKAKAKELARDTKRTRPALPTLKLERAALADGRGLRRAKSAPQKAPSTTPRERAEAVMCAEQKARRYDTFVPEGFNVTARQLSRELSGERTRKRVRAPQTRIGRGNILMGIYVGNHTVVTCKHAM